MNFWNHIARFILRNRLLLIFALVIYAGFMAYQAQYVEIAYRFVKVLPDTDQASMISIRLTKNLETPVMA